MFRGAHDCRCRYFTFPPPPIAGEIKEGAYFCPLALESFDTSESSTHAVLYFKVKNKFCPRFLRIVSLLTLHPPKEKKHTTKLYTNIYNYI